MNFPHEWLDWNMLPKEFLVLSLANYSAGDEKSSEHDRNGAFHWWLKRTPSKDILIRLSKLSWLDPDQIMASDVRNHIRKSANFDSEVDAFLNGYPE